MALATCTCLAGEVVFPAEHWQEKAPAELGFNPARLDAVAVALGGRGCIVKDGYVVKTWGSQSQKSDWFSSAKPVLSTLLMFAIQEGKVSGVDAPIAQFGWELKDKDRPMTFRHLVAMTSGYARPEPPGAAWAYNDYAIQLYQKTLFDRVFKESPEAVVSAGPRGWARWDWKMAWHFAATGGFRPRCATLPALPGCGSTAAAGAISGCCAAISSTPVIAAGSR